PLGKFKIVGPQSFLRSVNSCAAIRLQQWILHINGHRKRLEEAEPFRRPHLGERAQFRPANNFFVVGAKKLPAQRARQSKPAIVGGAAANPDQAANSPFFSGGFEDRAQPLGIELEWMILPGW